MSVSHDDANATAQLMAMPTPTSSSHRRDDHKKNKMKEKAPPPPPPPAPATGMASAAAKKSKSHLLPMAVGGVVDDAEKQQPMWTQDPPSSKPQKLDDFLDFVFAATQQQLVDSAKRKQPSSSKTATAALPATNRRWRVGSTFFLSVDAILPENREHFLGVFDPAGFAKAKLVRKYDNKAEDGTQLFEIQLGNCDTTICESPEAMREAGFVLFSIKQQGQNSKLPSPPSPSNKKPRVDHVQEEEDDEENKIEEGGEERGEVPAAEEPDEEEARADEEARVQEEEEEEEVEEVDGSDPAAGAVGSGDDKERHVVDPKQVADALRQAGISLESLPSSLGAFAAAMMKEQQQG